MSSASDSLVDLADHASFDKRQIRSSRDPTLTNKHNDDKSDQRDILTLEDCIDMDVDVLTTVLERNFQCLKRDTLEFFVDARGRFKSRALNELNQERRQTDRLLETKSEEISMLEDDLRRERSNNERHLINLNRMAEAIGSANQRKRNFRLLTIIFHSWRLFAKGERCFKRKMARAENHYLVELLQRRPLVQWVEYLRNQQRTCSKERFQRKVDIARESIEAQFEAKYKALEEENKKLREQIEVENAAREKLEEDMQQAFMRGVCALNMEALTVMKRGMPPGGVNPFFLVPDRTISDLDENVQSENR